MWGGWGEALKAAWVGSGSAEEGNGKGSGAEEREIDQEVAPQPGLDREESALSTASDLRFGTLPGRLPPGLPPGLEEQALRCQEGAQQPDLDRMESARSEPSVAESEVRFITAPARLQSTREEQGQPELERNDSDASDRISCEQDHYPTYAQSNFEPPAAQCIHPKYIDPSHLLATGPLTAPPAAAPPPAEGPPRRWASIADSETEDSQPSTGSGNTAPSKLSFSEAPSRLSSSEAPSRLSSSEAPSRLTSVAEEPWGEPWTNEVIITSRPEMDRSYSSVLNNDAVGTGHARSQLDSPQAWSALRDEVGEWMQIDLGCEQQVLGVITQGSAQPFDDQYVTKFNVSSSTDGVTYSRMGEICASGQSSHGERYPVTFPQAIAARYVCFNVEEWHKQISMRADVSAQIDAPGKWPRVDTDPLCEYLDNDRRVLARWLIRAKRMLREGSTEQRKLSQFFEVRLKDEILNFRLQLTAKSKGTGHQMSGFGKADGFGRVQVMLDRELPPSIPALGVRIAAGRGDTATAWQPRERPEVAEMKGSKPCFELSGVDWNFKSARDKDANQHLAIVVELSLGVQ